MDECVNEILIVYYSQMERYETEKVFLYGIGSMVTDINGDSYGWKCNWVSIVYIITIMYNAVFYRKSMAHVSYAFHDWELRIITAKGYW